MQRSEFERIVRRTAYRPATAAAIRADLEGQLCYQPEARSDGLDALAELLAPAISDESEPDLAGLARLAREHPEQPLCQFYLLAARRQAGDEAASREARAALAASDAEDPMAELFWLGLAGEPIPTVTEEVRLANIAKLAATPLLQNPYRLAVGSIFDAIRDRESARVLDVGVGSGAQMSALLDLVDREEHRLERLEIVGLDFVEDFLGNAGDTIAGGAAELAGRVGVSYVPVLGRVEALDEDATARITEGGAIDAANASIALHEVPGEAKVAALQNLRRLAPRKLVLAEWNYCLENVLPETSIEFLFNIRRVTAAMVAALRERYSLSEARAVARDWLSLDAGQLTCAPTERQECFLDAATWKVLLESSDFIVDSPDPTLLRHVDGAGDAALHRWYVATSRYANGVPISLIEASRGGGP